jgi:uncharacterized membrane protein YdbT with pleckstrin-like domain
MFELEKKYKGGHRTHVYLLFTKGWLFILGGIVFLYLSGSMYFGKLNQPTTDLLNRHPEWFVTTDMLALWTLLIGLSFLFVAYLAASVHHRYYKFMLDKHAVHLHRGWFFIRETTIPYHQISNVHIARPYHYRMMGLAQLDIVTAADKDIEKIGHRSKTFLMPVIDISLARNLSRFLLDASVKSRRGKYADETDLDDEDFKDEDDFDADITESESEMTKKTFDDDFEDDDEFGESDGEKQYVVIDRNR